LLAKDFIVKPAEYIIPGEMTLIHNISQYFALKYEKTRNCNGSALKSNKSLAFNTTF